MAWDMLPEEEGAGLNTAQLETESSSKSEKIREPVETPSPLTVAKQLTNKPAKDVPAVHLGSTVQLADRSLKTNETANAIQRSESFASIGLRKESPSSSSNKREADDISVQRPPPKGNVIDTLLGLLKINPTKNVTNQKADSLVSQDTAPQSQQQKDQNLQEPMRSTLANEPKPTSEDTKLRAKEDSLHHPWLPSDQLVSESLSLDVPQGNAEHMDHEPFGQNGNRLLRKPNVQTDQGGTMTTEQKSIEEHQSVSAKTPEVYVASDFMNEIQDMKERTVKDYKDTLGNPLSDPETMRQTFEKIQFQHNTLEDYKSMIANDPEKYVVQDLMADIQNMKESTVTDFKDPHPFWDPAAVKENFEKIDIQHLKDNTVRDYKDVVNSPFWDPTAMTEKVPRNAGTSKETLNVEELMTGMQAIKEEVLEHNERLLQETASLKAELKSEITALKDTIKATDKIADVKKDLMKEIAAVKDVAMQTFALEAKKSAKEIAAIKDEIILKIGAIDSAKRHNRVEDPSFGERPSPATGLRDQRDETKTIAVNLVKEIASQKELEKGSSGSQKPERGNEEEEEVLRMNELVTTMQGKVVTSFEKSGKEMRTMKEAILKELKAVQDTTAKNAEMLEKPIEKLATMQNALMRDVAVVKDKASQDTKLAEKPAKEIATTNDELIREIAAIKDGTNQYFAYAEENPANEVTSLKQEVTKKLSAKARREEKITTEMAAMKAELMRDIASIKDTSASNCASAAEKPVKEVAKIRDDFMKGIAEIKEDNIKMSQKPVKEIANMRDEILKLLEHYGGAKGESARQDKVQKVNMTRRNNKCEGNFPSAGTPQPVTELAPKAQLVNELESFKERTIQNALMNSIRMKEIAAVKDLLSKNSSVVLEAGPNQKTAQVFQQLAKDTAMRSQEKPTSEAISSLQKQSELPNYPLNPKAGSGSPKRKRGDSELNLACLKQAAASDEVDRTVQTTSKHVSCPSEPGTRSPYPASKSPTISSNRPPPFFPTNQSPNKRLSTSSSGTSLPADITRPDRDKVPTRSRSVPPTNPSTVGKGPLAGGAPSMLDRMTRREGADDNLIRVLKRGVVPIEQSKIREYFFPETSCTNRDATSAGNERLCPSTQQGSTASKPASSSNLNKTPPGDNDKNYSSSKKLPKSSRPDQGGSSPISIRSNSRGSPKSRTSAVSPTSWEFSSKARCPPRKTSTPTSQSYSVLESNRASASDGQCTFSDAGPPPWQGVPHSSSTTKSGDNPSILSTQNKSPKPGSPNLPAETSSLGKRVPTPNPSDFGTPSSGTGIMSGVDKGTKASKGISGKETFLEGVQPTEWDENGIAKMRDGLPKGQLSPAGHFRQNASSDRDPIRNATPRSLMLQTEQELEKNTNSKPSNENLVQRSDGTTEEFIERPKPNQLENARVTVETAFQNRKNPKETNNDIAPVSVKLERVSKPIRDFRKAGGPGGGTDVSRVKRFDMPAKASLTVLERDLPKENTSDPGVPSTAKDIHSKPVPSGNTNLPAVSQSDLPKRQYPPERSRAPATTILLLSRAAETLRIKISKPNTVNRRRSELITTRQPEDAKRLPEASENTSGPGNKIDITYHEEPVSSAPKAWSENPRQRQNDILSKLASLPAIIRKQDEARSTSEYKQTHVAKYERNAAKFERECTLGKLSTTRVSRGEDRNIEHTPSKRGRNPFPAGLQLPAIVPQTGQAAKILTKEQVADHNQRINKLERQKSAVREGLLKLKYVRERCNDLPRSLREQLRALLPDPEEMDRAIAEILSHERALQHCPQRGSFSEEIERAINEILSYEGVSPPPKPEKLRSFSEVERVIDEILSAEERKTTPLTTPQVSQISDAGPQGKPESKYSPEKLKIDSIKDSGVTGNPKEFTSEVLLPDKKVSEYRPRRSLTDQLMEAAPGQQTTKKPPPEIQLPPSTSMDRERSLTRTFPPPGKPNSFHDLKGPGGVNLSKNPGKSFHTAVSVDENLLRNSSQQTLSQDQNPRITKNIECKSGPPGCPCAERGSLSGKDGGNSKDGDGSGLKARDGTLPAIVNDSLNKQVATEMGAFLGYFKMVRAN